MKILPIFFLFARHFLCASSCRVARAKTPECKVHFRTDGADLKCMHVGGDGRAASQVLQQTPFIDESNRTRNYSFAELAPSAVSLSFLATEGNVTFEENSLAALPNLRRLAIENWAFDQSARSHLKIPSTELRNVPRLEALIIKKCILDEGAMQALLSLKNKLNQFAVQNSLPARRLLEAMSEFTNLTAVGISQLCDSEAFPMNMFKKSASKLERISVSYCSLPIVTRDLFRGMRSVTGIEWVRSNIMSIEIGAFDDLVSLRHLSLRENKIRTFPAGLFNNTKKLLQVDLMGNVPLEDLSRNNFTHLDHFASFQLDL